MAINLRKTVSKDKLKNKFEQDNQKGQGGSDFLPYFELKDKDSVILRFISDANPENQDFFTFTETVWNFNGKNMKYGGAVKDCPANKISADLFAEAKEAGEESAEGKEIRNRALKFYKKKKFLANCYIVDAPDYFWAKAGLDPDKIEDRTKVIVIPKNIYETIKDTVMDDEYDDVEFYNFGDDVVNFKLTVKKNAGGYNDYSLSKFEIKPKPLDVDDDEIDVIAENIKNLSEIFKIYSPEDFQEALDVELSDDDDDEEEEAPAPKPRRKKAAVVEEEDDEDEEEAPAPKKRKKAAVVEEEDEEDEEDEEESTSSIKNMRANILSKLKKKDSE